MKFIILEADSGVTLFSVDEVGRYYNVSGEAIPDVAG